MDTPHPGLYNTKRSYRSLAPTTLPNRLISALGAPEAAPSILLVDDDPGILETLVDIFDEMGFETTTALTGRDALSKMRDRFFNIALLDIRLPDMQGTELLAQAKDLRPDTQYIMATGNASLPTALDSLNQGAYAYLEKPIELPNVKATVRRALEQQRLQLSNRRLLDQLRALGEITTAALATLEPGDLLERLLSHLVHHHGADGGVIYLLDDDGQLIPRITQGHRTGKEQPLMLGEGMAGKAALLRDILPALASEIEGDPITKDEVGATVAAPLLWRDQLVGALRLDRVRPEPFQGSTLEQLAMFAERAGTIIGNARLYDTERRLHHEAQSFSQLTSALVEQVGLEERLNLISDHLLQVTGTSRCLVWLAGRDGLVCSYTSGVDDPRLQRLLRRFELPTDATPRALLEISRCERAGPELLEKLLPEDLRSELNACAALLLPLRLGGQLIGLIAVDEPGLDRGFSEREMEQARTTANIAAPAIQQARTIREERATLQTLAESFLTRPPRLPDLDLADRYEPASMVAQVGGDYYDFIDLGDERIGLVIGDVCGKERAAAIYVAMAKYMLRAYALQDPAPREVLTKLNRSLYNEMSEDCMFITMFYCIVDRRSGLVTYTNAGHPAPLLYRPSTGQVEELKSPALNDASVRRPTDGMVGAIPDMEFTQSEVMMEPGSILALFTDGVTEARSDVEMLESEGVQQVIREHAGETAAQIVTGIYDRALEFAAGVLRDDVAIVVAKRV